MAQSLSGGSGSPSRMALTVIRLRRESSNMQVNYSMCGAADFADARRSDLRSSAKSAAYSSRAFWGMISVTSRSLNGSQRNEQLTI
jgi:hypothetical protein